MLIPSRSHWSIYSVPALAAFVSVGQNRGPTAILSLSSPGQLLLWWALKPLHTSFICNVFCFYYSDGKSYTIRRVSTVVMPVLPLSQTPNLKLPLWTEVPVIILINKISFQVEINWYFFFKVPFLKNSFHLTFSLMWKDYH